MTITKVNKADNTRVTMAACDRCNAICDGTDIPKGGNRASDDATDAAKAAGWTEAMAPVRGKRRMTWTVELLCPACQEKSE